VWIRVPRPCWPGHRAAARGSNGHLRSVPADRNGHDTKLAPVPGTAATASARPHHAVPNRESVSAARKPARSWRSSRRSPVTWDAPANRRATPSGGTGARERACRGPGRRVARYRHTSAPQPMRPASTTPAPGRASRGPVRAARRHARRVRIRPTPLPRRWRRWSASPVPSARWHGQSGPSRETAPGCPG